ncbi:unnamed protein product [Cladocopium goreaui]|uniref:Rhodanese domain-containing protein n=1 Tax=Cladocopium goreaui TaxID=2562237 RepID=A0A9P1CM28_9DINO|nr:unnamed protein product [Cladocopium goreaui]|mmetsp:Transcript_19061/g.42044  ORF Transcript_19061/g.42044 Transcript_19061/m.42044 type:complete len:229 (+) Transcript_19061:54-740(+)
MALRLSRQGRAALGCLLLLQLKWLWSFSGSRRRFATILATAAGSGPAGVHAQSVQYNAQLGGDLNEAQKTKIKEYLAKQQASTEPVSIGDHTMKVYEPPTAEELTPGSSPFRARVALLKQRLGERLVAVPEGLEMIKKGALLVDVRTREQIQSQTNGRIPQGAMVLPLDDWVGRVPPVMAGKKILLTCWKGNKSTLAWEALRAQFADAYVLDGGYNAWEAAGLATQSI